jgi:hypothetical protein
MVETDKIITDDLHRYLTEMSLTEPLNPDPNFLAEVIPNLPQCNSKKLKLSIPRLSP